MMRCCSNTEGCPICKTATAISGNHKCSDYYTTTAISSPPEELDVSKISVTVPLSLLVEIYALSKSLDEKSIEKQILKILKGV